jgi:hypothetical protein
VDANPPSSTLGHQGGFEEVDEELPLSEPALHAQDTHAAAEAVRGGVTLKLCSFWAKACNVGNWLLHAIVGHRSDDGEPRSGSALQPALLLGLALKLLPQAQDAYPTAS